MILVLYGTSHLIASIESLRKRTWVAVNGKETQVSE